MKSLRFYLDLVENAERDAGAIQEGDTTNKKGTKSPLTKGRRKAGSEKWFRALFSKK